MGLLLRSDGRVLARRVDVARTATRRMKGLLGRDPLGPDEALILVPARQVHTFGLSYPIDVVLCDENLVVLRVVNELAPRRLTRWVRRARVVVELRAGTCGADLAPGEQLVLESSVRAADRPSPS